MGGDGEGATQFHDYEDGGIGEGEGVKDISDKIENEEQASWHLNHCSRTISTSIKLNLIWNYIDL